MSLSGAQHCDHCAVNVKSRLQKAGLLSWPGLGQPINYYKIAKSFKVIWNFMASLSNGHSHAIACLKNGNIAEVLMS